MDIYTINERKGLLERIPTDWELKQAIKYLLIFFAGIVLGNMWRLS